MEKEDIYEPLIDLNLKSYIKVYKNAIPSDLSTKIISDLQEKSFQKHTFYDSRMKKHVTRSDDKELTMLSPDDYRNEDLNSIIWDLLHKYHEELNFPWLPGWGGFTFPRWNAYNKSEKMALHCDRIKSMFEGERQGDPTLSILGLLDNDFSGGQFVMHNEELQDFNRGDVVIFPSNFLYPHKVEPVVSGKRYSFISWSW